MELISVLVDCEYKNWMLIIYVFNYIVNINSWCLVIIYIMSFIKFVILVEKWIEVLYMLCWK